ncbi:MAG: ABC-F family ATP-binding cassette domain-containing protein [Bdellovibrio sp.]|nr:ABC-F family ATP-binding cassette domain-containing protein [Bdellovibrio sp.]
MGTLCTLQNLTLTYPHKTIFQNITFTVNEGERIGLLGLNGHGKSSLFKILADVIPPDTTVPPFSFDKNKNFSVFIVPQELPILEGVSLSDYFFEFYPEFKIIKQQLDQINIKLTSGNDDFDSLLAKQTQLYEELNKKGEDRIYNSYLSYLKFFGLTDHTQTMSDFSGGEQRKVGLALGLSAPHELILWDEPTNHLDLETIDVFEDELLNSKKTFMIISHDRSLLNNVVDRIIHIQNGKIKSFVGTYLAYLDFLKEAQREREKELDKLSNYQRRETAWISRGARARRTKSKKRIEDYGLLNQKIRELKDQAHKQVELNLKNLGRKTKILVQAESLGLCFDNKKLFTNLTFKIARGDKIALIGKNGVGKSSLLKLIMGKLQPSAGMVRCAENLSFGLFSQKRENLNPEETPWHLVGEGIDFVISNTGEKRHVTGYLENFLFTPDEIKRPIKTFSGGEKNRLQLAQFMRHAQDIWIFDEPTNDLDLETIGILEEELKNYSGALIVVGHDRTFIENVTDQCWLIHDGGLEIFTGGFSQAEMFLEAITLESDLKNLAEKRNSGSIKDKLSYKDKQRLLVIQSEIEAQENVVTALRTQLASFDYNTMGKENSQSLVSLQQQINHAEKKLDDLINEWVSLEEKSSTT